MDRKSGVLLHISSLPGDYSSGSFGENAISWIDLLKSMGFGYWQVLPFCMPDQCNSPYKSFSAFSGNPYFIDLKKLYDNGLLTKSELDDAVQTSPFYCEFKKLASSRLPLLKKAADRFTDYAAAEQFCREREYVNNFCKFMALKSVNNDKVWTDWTQQEYNRDDYRFWVFVQYMFFTQWKEIKDYANKKGVKIIGDIPIYVDFDSSDVWCSPGDFLLDKRNMPIAVAGVPPDYYCEDGQLWGNPLYDWDAMKLNGYSWWKARISYMAELFDGIRIDHFRAVESYFSIPSGEKTAKNGVWEKGPGMDFVNAIKEASGDAVVIAEDLGVITDQVKALVLKSGFPGMRVFQFAFMGDEKSPHLPHNYTNNSVAYSGTHDNNTLLGWVWEISDAERKKMLRYCGYQSENWDNCYDSILRTLFASHAGLLVLPLQDLLLYGCDTRINIPGRADGNWAYRITDEQLSKIDKEKFLSFNTTYGRK